MASASKNGLLNKLDGIESRFQEVRLLITDPSVISDMKRYVRLNREYKDLEPLVNAHKELIKLYSNINEAREFDIVEKDGRYETDG